MIKLTSEQFAVLARAVADTAENELDCDEVLDLLAVYVEQAGDIQSLPAALRPVAQHIRICPECRQEHEALLRAIRM